MHTNYYFLRQLAPALQLHLLGLKLMECFSQDRDELILVFAQARGKHKYYRPFYIKATLRPDFSGLLFPETIQRARANSVNLFQTLYERSVLGVRAFLNERCLAIQLEGRYTILFKFFGNRPNLLVFDGEVVIDTFNRKLISDSQLHLSSIDRPIDQSFEAYERNGFDHRKLFPTFGKVINTYLEEKISSGELLQTGSLQTGSWHSIQEVLQLLEFPRYYLTAFQHQPTLSLLPVGGVCREFDNPLEAANCFYLTFMGQNTLDREKGDALRVLEKRLKRIQASIDINLRRLIDLEEGVKNEEIAHVLMANLHQISDRADSVELYDFYRDQPIVIKLKPDASPQKNAETYYRKAKNEKIELHKLQEQLGVREQELGQLQQQRKLLQSIDSLKELRKYRKDNQIQHEKATDQSAPLFKQIIYEDFCIVIGRNAKNNELLTQRYAFKEDLWLHARDVPGSHVLVKYQAGKKFPKTVVERAAELAAWYSKRRTETLCPVIVTPKKFVRKAKGLADGQVLIEKEEVVLVRPRGEN